MALEFDLPTTLEVCGKEYEIDTRWKVWAEIGIRARGAGAEDVAEMLVSCFGRRLPERMDEAVRAMLGFYRREKTSENGCESGGSDKAVFDIEYDFGYVNAAFMHSYGIDLRQSELHWWAFWELFEALDEDEKIMKIISWRAADLSGIKDKSRRTFLRKMKRLYKLPDRRSEEEKERSVAEALARNMGM